MQLEIHVKSDIGRIRRGNEDNFLLLNLADALFEIGGGSTATASFGSIEIKESGIVLAVSDGMGGALAGEVASLMAVETVRDALLENDPETTLKPEADQSLIERLYEAALEANRAVFLKGRSDAQFNGMGATFTGAAITREGVNFLQIGDSRAYVIRGNQIEQATKDQSLVQQLVDSNQIAPEEAERHHLRNVILQALGAQSEIYPMTCRVVPRQNDVLLLCSDGLSNKLSKEDLIAIVQQYQSNLSGACTALINEANARGGEDNITVVLAKLEGNDLPEGLTEPIQVFQMTTSGFDLDEDTFVS